MLDKLLQTANSVSHLRTHAIDRTHESEVGMARDQNGVVFVDQFRVKIFSL